MTCPSFCQVEGCTLPYGRHLTFHVPASATPTRTGGIKAALANRQDKARVKDLDAYQRLRADGLQPPATKGAHRLEAVSQIPEHVNTGMTHVQPRAWEAFHESFGHKATDAA